MLRGKRVMIIIHSQQNSVKLEAVDVETITHILLPHQLERETREVEG